MRRYLTLGILAALALCGLVGLYSAKASAADNPNFSLQITPSPLVATVKPGQTSNLEVKIRNPGDQPQALKIEPRSFRIDNEKVTLNDNSPAEISEWMTFSQPRFTVNPGEWFTQKITLDVPKDAGFSYSFALVISPQNEPKATSGGRMIKGSVADFTLINVDRPGATRKLEAATLSMSKNLYEYLPATVNVKFKNTGNTIVQPYGNIFIQRGSKSESPLATLTVNESRGYILPGTERTLTSQWTDGFPAYQTTTDSSGAQKQKLVWDWGKASQFRIGRYTAQLVAVYNDGQHDVPIRAEVSFWVLPWKILLGLTLVLLLILFGLWTIVRKMIRLASRNKRTKPPVVR